ncbi:MAG: ShlB/FhaC/HecB family hemolysin secretion/activation protein, partial [Sphingomonadales bacterium]|nr:ShlB/FhaC/HecB family hemolysin secretion/activation protein [Sphingomonadales bacterium]
VTGLGDRTAVSFFTTADFDEQLVVNALHDFAIGGDGLRVGAEFTYGWNDPTIGAISPFDTETMVVSLRATYPFVLDQGTRIDGRWGVDFINQDVRFAGIDLNRDRLRVAYAGVSFLATDRRSIEGTGGFTAAEPRWRFGLSGELRQGLDIFDASEPGFVAGAPPQTRGAGDSSATVFRLESVAEFRPMPALAWIFESRLQLTGDPLLAYEEFAGGNYTVGRGYDPGSVLGDRGFGFRSEIRIGSIIPRTEKDLAFQPYGFFDAAWVDNEDPQFFGLPNSDEIYSVGGGVRFNYGNRARLDVALAVPLVETNFQANTPDPRLLVSLFVRFAR